MEICIIGFLFLVSVSLVAPKATGDAVVHHGAPRSASKTEERFKRYYPHSDADFEEFNRLFQTTERPDYIDDDYLDLDELENEDDDDEEIKGHEYEDENYEDMRRPQNEYGDYEEFDGPGYLDEDYEEPEYLDEVFRKMRKSPTKAHSYSGDLKGIGARLLDMAEGTANSDNKHQETKGSGTLNTTRGSRYPDDKVRIPPKKAFEGGSSSYDYHYEDIGSRLSDIARGLAYIDQVPSGLRQFDTQKGTKDTDDKLRRLVKQGLRSLIDNDFLGIFDLISLFPLRK